MEDENKEADEPKKQAINIKMFAFSYSITVITQILYQFFTGNIRFEVPDGSKIEVITN